jgi:hypothetical protein
MRLVLAIDPGTKFGMLTVVSLAPDHVTPNGTRFRMVVCACECGNEKLVRLSELTRKDNKRTVSCGCYRAARNRLQPPPVCTVHGLTSRRGNHYLYVCWKAIKRRCLDRSSGNYYLYGARGISVYSGWINDPAAFVSYVITVLGDRPTPCHSIDRADNNGNYEPGNLRWATKSQQVHNRRPPSEWLAWGARTGRQQ